MIDDDKILQLLTNPKTQQQGFSIIVNQYSEQLYWKIRRIVLTHEDANDVLQNTFIKAWNNIERFQNKSKLITWLYHIAINESLDFLRHQKVEMRMSADDDNGVGSQLLADEYFDGDEMEAQLQQAISLLPDVQRTVFNLRYYEEMKYSEMSILLDTSEGALKTSYHLAVKKITEYFKKRNL